MALGARSDVFASRVHRGGKSTRPTSGEAFYLCHMTALPHSDVFLIERQLASIGQRAAHLAGTSLVHDPADLLTALGSVE